MGRRSVFVLFDCVGSADGFPLSERQLHQRFEIVAAGEGEHASAARIAIRPKGLFGCMWRRKDVAAT